MQVICSRVCAMALFVIALLCFITWPTRLAAQSGAGSIQGTITDPSGAVVAKAAVHVVNDETGESTDATSNGSGYYQVPALFTGNYTVSISAPGFKTYATKIELLVAQNAVINALLTTGRVTQQVVVSANAVQLTTPDSGTLTSTLENSRIDQLPENGRLLVTLTQMTTPGLNNVGENINGLNPEALEYVADGVTTSNRTEGGAYAYKTQMQDPDSIQEVKMVTSDASARYASPGTAIITTKSGTNTLHGTLFETARNNDLGVAKSRQDAANFSAPHLVRNEFGASVGGPIIIPHVYHGKDRTFFFFAYERYSLANPTSVLSSVATLAMRQGDFSQLTNSSGVLQQLYDPSTTRANAACPTPALVNGAQVWNAGTPINNPYCRTPLGNGNAGSSANNQIPTALESPTAKIYFDLVGLPTSDDNPLVQSNRTSLEPGYQVVPQETFRLDHEFSENNRAYLRYTQVFNTVNIKANGAVNAAADGIAYGAASNYINQPGTTFTPSVGYTHIFSPTLFSETVFGMQWLTNYSYSGTNPNVDYEQMLGLPNNFGEDGFPNMDALSGTQSSFGSVQLVWNIDENLTKTLGRHQLEFGGRYRHTRLADEPPQLSDAIGFDALQTALYNPGTGAQYENYANTGYEDANLFLGSAASYETTLEPPRAHYHQVEFDGYLQDNYHVSQTFTVNLGLRYEAHPAMWTKYGLMNSFDLKNDAMVLAAPPSTLIAEGYTTQAIITNLENIGVKFETPAEAGMPATTLLDNYDLNFLPRFGIAYLPFGGRPGTVIRGGYGRYLFPEPLEYSLYHSQGQVPFATSYTQNYESAAQSADGRTNSELLSPVSVVMGVNSANVVNSSTTNAILPGTALWSKPANWAPDTATEVNVTLEQPLKGHSVVSASWVYTHGSNLDHIYDYNNHPSNYVWELAYGTTPPQGNIVGSNQYAATATGPYDQTTWGAGSSWHPKSGWSNDNALQINYQRLYHRGIAYQISYVYSKALAMGGDGTGTVDPAANFPGVLGTVGTMIPSYGPMYVGAPPPSLPKGAPVWAEYQAMNRYQAYIPQSDVPKTHVVFNGVVDLPFGRGKRFFSNSNHLVNELIGGFQLAGDGNVYSQIFSANTGNWGPTHPLTIYKHHEPIMDCRSGVCHKSYMWFNGYLAPTVTQGVSGSVCTKNCVTGLPADYEPDQTPIDNTPGSPYYGNDEVSVKLANGSIVNTVYSGGPNGADYLSRTWLNGPINWTIDTSLFKVFPITEKTYLRFNMDVFNTLNMQGYVNPAANGVENLLSSANTPRQIQLTLRFTY